MNRDEAVIHLRDDILMQYELVALLGTLDPGTKHGIVRHAHTIANRRLFELIEDYVKTEAA